MNTNVPLMLALIVATAFGGLTACSQQNENQKVASNPFISSAESQTAESVHPVATIATNYSSTQPTAGIAATVDSSPSETTLAPTPATTELGAPTPVATQNQNPEVNSTTNATIIAPEAPVMPSSESVAQATVAPVVMQNPASISVTTENQVPNMLENKSTDAVAAGSTETQAVAVPAESVQLAPEENNLDKSTASTSESSIMPTLAPQSATSVPGK